MTRPYGMAEAAFNSYIKATFQAGVNPEKTKAGGKRVVQTIGGAPASAGTHAKDGTLDGKDYCAAVDISCVHDLDLKKTQELVKALWKNGFIAWHRNTGSFANNQHIHAVYVGVYMKKALRAQVHSFLANRSGLVGNSIIKFQVDNLTVDVAQNIRELFLDHNQAVGFSGQGQEVTETNYEDYLEEDTCCSGDEMD
jgi:hypothetical protein